MSEQNTSKGKIRRDKIMNLIKRQGRITVQDIVDHFDCSEATARRDLDMLELSEAIIRTIGGAIYSGFVGASELSFTEKKNISWTEKERIAAKAASLIGEGDVIGLTGGTTTYLIAKELKSRSGLTVVTNAVNIAMELADSDGIQVVVIGGIMRNKSFELYGPLAEKMVEELHIGKMFMGIDGLTAQEGITTFSEQEAQIAKVLIRRSRQIFAVFDHTKAGRSSLFSIAPVSSLHGCITDAAPTGELLQEMNHHDIHLYLTETAES